MCKRKFLLASFVLLLVWSPSLMATPVGVFDFTEDVGRAEGTCLGYGSTQYFTPDEYIITAAGAGMWGHPSGFHYAYKQLSGNQRFSYSPEWIMAQQYWAKQAPLITNGRPGDIPAGGVFFDVALRRNDDYTEMQTRTTAGDGCWTIGTRDGNPDSIGIQRVTVGSYTVVQGLIDFGSGWESMGIYLNPPIEDEALFGVAVSSETNNWDQGMAQARLSNVLYESDPGLIGVVTVTADLKLDDCATDIPGFKIRSLKGDPKPDNWGWDGMNDLLDGSIPSKEEGSRVEPLVNLYDSGGRGAFKEENGYADQSYPGIDVFEQPALEPASGDGDDDFATEVIGCIELTAGLHVLGANSDDGTIIWIGGLEIGRTEEWKGDSNRDFLFVAEEAGKYDFLARSLEGGGGASLELHEILADGTRILLNDTSVDGASKVYVPEPATIALLGFGGLAMLRIRKKR